MIKADYWSYFTKVSKRKIIRYISGLTIAFILLVILHLYTELILLESLAAGIMTFFVINILFEFYDLFRIHRYLIKYEKSMIGGKCNLIVFDTHIEISHPLEKRVVFFSQLTKLKVIDDVLFFIEKKSKNLPLKVNKKEISDNSFKRVVNVIKSKRIKIEN